MCDSLREIITERCCVFAKRICRSLSCTKHESNVVLFIVSTMLLPSSPPTSLLCYHVDSLATQHSRELNLDLEATIRDTSAFVRYRRRMIKEWVNRLWQYFLQVNLYRKASSTEETLAQERILTRIYLVLLCCLLLAIGITSASILHTVKKTENTPSAARFQYLDQRYHDTLQCPCSKGGIAYKKFLFIDPKFHQVCASEFVTQPWIDAALAASHSFLSTSDSFRDTLTFFWQTVASLCRISNQTWTSAISDFRDSYIISPKAVTNDHIERQVQSDLRNHIASAEAKLSGTLGALQRSIAGNQFVSALATNFYLDRRMNKFGDPLSPRMSPRTFNDCSCMRIAGCPRPATVNDSLGEMVRVPGMITDCLIVDATLASTLECYYDRACVSLLHGSDSEQCGIII